MNTALQTCLLGFLLLSMGCTNASKTMDEAKEKIQQLIPSAAGMKSADFQDLASGGQTQRLDLFEDQSFTLAVFCQPVTSNELSDAQLREFQFHEGSTPNPNTFAKWIQNSRLDSTYRGPVVTAIPSKGIKNYSCTIEGKLATGVFEYEVPEYCRGRVQFSAREDRGTWQITEFSMPARGIKLTFQDGIWKQDR